MALRSLPNQGGDRRSGSLGRIAKVGPEVRLDRQAETIGEHAAAVTILPRDEAPGIVVKSSGWLPLFHPDVWNTGRNDLLPRAVAFVFIVRDVENASFEAILNP